MKPLAARMRPTDLAEVVGQGSLLADGGSLREFLAARTIPSLLLWGPPGAGKTTIARLLAGAAGARFVELSAVSDGVADVRRVIAEAKTAAAAGERTVLFLDEVHRFAKSQQDALLPSVEEGVITLVAATTENPSVSVTAPLRSRLRLLRLEPLTDENVGDLVDRALVDPRGFGGQFTITPDARRQVVGLGNGDARRALTILDLAGIVTGRKGGAVIEAGDVLIAAAERGIDHDHSGALSAMIKSIRGNDPDAALYWLAALLGAGEDPRVVTRRLLVSAGEEIGAADPRALSVAAAADMAATTVGMPEVQYPLAAAVTILATMPKSPRAQQAYFAAQEEILRDGVKSVPSHLRPNARTYRHPHGVEGFDLDQVYLPRSLEGRRFYHPSSEGEEAAIAKRLSDWQQRRRSGT